MHPPDPRTGHSRVIRVNPIEACQACGSAELESFYSLMGIPVNSCLMVDTRKQALEFPTGDLELAYCHDCGFIQNVRFDSSAQRYSSDYEETQAYSPRFVRFLENLCDDQIGKHDLAGKTVVEIGCGKGEFLAMLCERGDCRGIGFDPSFRPDRTAGFPMDRLTFVREFYDQSNSRIPADYVCCRHTLEHIPNVYEFLGMVQRSTVSSADVTVLFELPDITRVLEEFAFQDLYYEHCSYFSPGSLARLFRRCGFAVADLWMAYDDQYVMIEARLAGLEQKSDRFELETDLSDLAASVSAFKAGIGTRLERARAEVVSWYTAGRRIVLWGSGSKAVSYLSTLGLTDEIAAVVDVNPHKHGKYLAGTGHQILSPASLEDSPPDTVIVMNSIYLDEIRLDLQSRRLSPEILSL